MPGSHYIGKAGHLAVMGELALRGYNVAMPEIDVGDDVFVLNENNGKMRRLQVKTSLGYDQKKSHRFQFRVGEDSIKYPNVPEMHFVFVMRHLEQWYYIAITRAQLKKYIKDQKLGSKSGSYRQLTFILNHNCKNITCSGFQLDRYLNTWTTWKSL